MRSEDNEYRQRNHRPSYQYENPMEEHRDIMTRIRAQDKSDQPASARGIKKYFRRAVVPSIFASPPRHDLRSL
jgi:hypothetical protein